VVQVHKRVTRKCATAAVNAGVVRRNPACFQACPQPTNASSTCWIQCFYGTMLGPDRWASSSP
jgi:hypothetical protein